MAVLDEKNYHDEQNKQNILKMRAVLETLPPFARLFSVESRNIPLPVPDWDMPTTSGCSLNIFMNRMHCAKIWK